MSKARIILPVEGMSCASCAATIQEALSNAPGVASATVNYATAKAAVEYDDSQTRVSDLIRTVRGAGYDCGIANVTFTVEDLHYASSVAPLERELGRVNGVVRAAANQATETVTVDYVPGVATADELERAVAAAGLLVAAPAVTTMESAKRVDLLGRLLMPLALRLRALLDPAGRMDPAWLKRGLAIVTLPVLLWSGQQFFRGAWSGLRHRTADMNTLIGGGTGAAYVYSLVATLAPGLFTTAGLPADVYYEAVAAIIAHILLGRLLEAGAKGRA